MEEIQEPKFKKNRKLLKNTRRFKEEFPVSKSYVHVILRGRGGKVGHSAFPLADFAAIERRNALSPRSPLRKFSDSRLLQFTARLPSVPRSLLRRRHARSPRLLQKPTFSRLRRFLGGAVVASRRPTLFLPLLSDNFSIFRARRFLFPPRNFWTDFVRVSLSFLWFFLRKEDLNIWKHLLGNFQLFSGFVSGMNEIVEFDSGSIAVKFSRRN